MQEEILTRPKTFILETFYIKIVDKRKKLNRNNYSFLKVKAHENSNYVKYLVHHSRRPHHYIFLKKVDFNKRKIRVMNTRNRFRFQLLAVKNKVISPCLKATIIQW